ncbi:MAG TPA: hypothetical protein VNA12_04120 [Mycobacteriales bacterium]|nr:hypothetical protein [Mycobacteriales bacterium]
MLLRPLMGTTLAVLLTASAALAAPTPPKPQIVDPKGDSVGSRSDVDIVSVQYSTTGTGSGRSYVSKKLIVALTLAGPPASNGVTTYVVRSDTDSCGVIEFKWAPGTVGGGLIGDTTASFGSCKVDDDSTAFFAAKVKGSTATFEVALKPLKDITRGTVFSEFRAAVDVGDPVFGIFPGNDSGLLDSASGDGTWVIP